MIDNRAQKYAKSSGIYIAAAIANQVEKSEGLNLDMEQLSIFKTRSDTGKKISADRRSLTHCEYFSLREVT